MSNNVEHVICGINADANEIRTATIMNGRVTDIKSFVLDYILHNPFMGIYSNFKLEYDGSGVLGKRKFRSIDELLHPERYNDTDLWYNADMEAFVGSVRIMANSGARNIETFRTKCSRHVYAIRDDGYHNITIVIPSDVVQADTLKSELTGTRGIFTNDKLDNIVYDSITVIGGSPNLLSVDGLLANCSAKSLDASKLCVESLVSISYLFEDAWIENMDIQWLRGAELSSVNGAFNGLYSNNGVIDLSCLNTGKVREMVKMLSDANVFDLIGSMDTSNVCNMESMFNNFNLKIEYTDCDRKLDLSWMNMINVISVKNMFRYIDLDELIVDWRDMTEVQDMYGMFSDVKKVNIVGMEKWRTPKLIDVTNMFNSASIRGKVTLGGDFPKYGNCYVSMLYNAWIDVVDFTNVRMEASSYDESSMAAEYNIFNHFTGTLLFKSGYKGTEALMRAAKEFKELSSQGKNLDVVCI